MTTVIDKSHRDRVTRSLAIHLSKTSSVIIERALHATYAGDLDSYLDGALQTVEDARTDPMNPKALQAQIKAGQVGWGHPHFKCITAKVEEQDNFIMNPLKMEEGIFECKKCCSRRVYSYSKQTRACDESSTTFALCMACGDSWTYSG